jgi:ABC-type transporter Mla subunit MlaD
MSRYLKTSTSIGKLEAMQAKADQLAAQYSTYDEETSDLIFGISASIELALERLRQEEDARNERVSNLRKMFKL